MRPKRSSRLPRSNRTVGTPGDADILRHLAREERFTPTLKAFPGLKRERIVQLLERMASLTASGSTSGEASGRMRVYSDGAARGNPGPAGAGAGMRHLAALGRQASAMEAARAAEAKGPEAGG